MKRGVTRLPKLPSQHILGDPKVDANRIEPDFDDLNSQVKKATLRMISTAAATTFVLSRKVLISSITVS